MLHYIDCGARFFNSTDIMDIVMPDGLHPNHAGQEMLAQVGVLLRFMAVPPCSSSGRSCCKPSCTLLIRSLCEIAMPALHAQTARKGSEMELSRPFHQHFCDMQCYAPLIASLVTTRSTADANATAVEKPAPPVNPCKATDSSEQPSTASGSSASGSAPAAAGSHPSAGVEGNVADVSGDSSVLLRRAEALAQRTRTMGSSNILDFAPDLACLLC